MINSLLILRMFLRTTDLKASNKLGADIRTQMHGYQVEYQVDDDLTSNILWRLRESVHLTIGRDVDQRNEVGYSVAR